MSDPSRPTGASSPPDDPPADGPADGDRQRDRADWPVAVYRMGEEPPDWKYWLSRSMEERLAAGEEMRRRYYGQNYDASERFPRLCRIVHRS